MAIKKHTEELYLEMHLWKGYETKILDFIEMNEESTGTIFFIKRRVEEFLSLEANFSSKFFNRIIDS